MAKKTEDVIKQLTKDMEEEQSPKRFQHTLGVSFTAAALAMKHGGSINDARIAGLLHDCAKGFSDEKMLKFCEKNQVKVSSLEKRNPYLLHGKVGARIAKSKYEIEDQDILNAIENHTTGRPEMSILEKIIFIADYMEPGRKDAPELDVVRKMAFEDLDKTLVKILGDTLEYLKNKDKEIDPMTEVTYQYYAKLSK